MSEDSRNIKALQLVEVLATARAQFYDEIMEYAVAFIKKRSEREQTYFAKRDIQILRSRSFYTITEFYYLADEYKLAIKANLADCIARHNQEMISLKNDTLKLRRMGLSRERIERAIFHNNSQIHSLLRCQVDDTLRINAYSLARFLVEFLSFQSCLNVVSSMVRAGLLERYRFQGMQLIVPSSNGALVKSFRKHLILVIQSF